MFKIRENNLNIYITLLYTSYYIEHSTLHAYRCLIWLVILFMNNSFLNIKTVFPYRILLYFYGF